MKIDKLPKKVIPMIEVEDWERIVAESEGAQALLTDPKFSFFRDYLNNIKSSILELIATNSIKDVVEMIPDQAGGSRSIKTSRDEQLYEIGGKYKLINQIFKDLAVFASQKDEYEKKADEKQIIIAVTKEDETSRTI